MQNNWQLYKKSIANHPGLLIGAAWPFLVAAAICRREEMPPLHAILIVTACVGALPWIPILITAWTLRHQYRDA